jgi:hypothetical protein
MEFTSWTCPLSPPHTTYSEQQSSPEATYTSSPLEPWTLPLDVDTLKFLPVHDNLNSHFQVPTTTTMHNLDTMIASQAAVPGPGLDDSMISSSEETIGAPPPRRNLTEAFEELFEETDLPHDMIDTTLTAGIDIDTDGNSMPLTSLLSPRMDKSDKSKECLISPTGVADMPAEVEVSCQWPGLGLHFILQRELSQALVDRVSFYGIIHDINKECTAMAANDPVVSTQTHTDNSGSALQQEETSALVTAVTGLPAKERISDSNAVCIDEEKWLLSTIRARSSDEIRSCPETFLQAMGEKEYENPVASLAGASRTQLWKPSRSWWEAKSGKNPWIEPASHNKRWR